ncbi:LuxR C-terminal-related transcriptional regulator [Gracilibacillus alcaliphilus]|uniref:LuxR C-terminal-related transcriptional regulator n=1 Tax=Gracilibacillus alcaliphilus TaxID=1401441 RepID=UPI00195C33D6|nr:LuxR C-terminal-related transcriptional regulator [Gracilibacillus alcaliphilus]MBM7676310.1 ATP/maltotriose-dependent transcriptional regulator MalT [Gracilibacillus alcaliphilus]
MERRNKYTTEQLQALAEKTAGLLYTRGDYNTAIELELERGLYLSADQWIAEQLLDIFYSGQIRLLIQWVDNLREAAYPVNVETLVIYAVSLTTIQNMEKADRVIKELDNRHVQEGWQDQEEYAEPASILRSLKAYVKLATGEQEAFIELLTEQVKKGLINDKWYLAPVQYNPFHAKLTRTSFGSKGKYSAVNEVRAFLEVFRQTEFKEQHVMGYSYGVFAEILYETNQLEEVLLEIHEGMQYALRFKDHGLYVPLSILKGKVYMIQGQMTAAHAVWDQALSHVSEWYWWRSIEAMKALAYLRENKPAEAEKELFKTIRPDSLQIELGQELWLLVYCRLLMKKNEWEMALKIVIQVREHAAEDEQIDLLIESAVLEAICHKQLKQEEIASVTLHEALVLGSSYGYKRIFLDENGFKDVLMTYQTFKRKTKLIQEDVPAVYLEGLGAKERSSIPVDDSVNTLTPREIDDLRLLISGVSNREMAKQLFLTEGTIRVYLTKIYSKLGVQSRAQAILKAKEWKL